MKRDEVLRDVTRLINASKDLHDASENLEDYFFAVKELERLAELVEKAEEPKMKSASEEGFKPGGGSFGGGGASGSW